MTTLPTGFTPHPKIATLLQKRLQAVKSGGGIDWGNAETLAYATLLVEGIDVRLSGQDSRRGTFNHRHAVLHDIHSESTHTPLSSLSQSKARFFVYDSLLSENAVLGFEYGYAVSSPKPLVIWEAQFGDFANGAQVVIDQCIVAGESKWDRDSGLVLLLPHGFEGQGSEHSSARIERYLQLCAENNLQVCTPSTPAQFFHLLRRQMKQPFRRPLVVFTPKSLLRHPRCVSARAELEAGSFQEFLLDGAEGVKVTTVILCSGKIFFELLERKETEGRDDLALIRVEQLYPLHTGLLRDVLALYQGVERFCWVQEEPANMGAWSFLRPQLAEIIGSEPHYIGRPAAPAPATGSHRIHKEEQEKIIIDAFAW